MDTFFIDAFTQIQFQKWVNHWMILFSFFQVYFYQMPWICFENYFNSHSTSKWCICGKFNKNIRETYGRKPYNNIFIKAFIKFQSIKNVSWHRLKINHSFAFYRSIDQSIYLFIYPSVLANWCKEIAGILFSFMF